MMLITESVLHAAAPRADATVWLPVLAEAFERWGIDNSPRVAAALGQFAAEAGEDFGELRECMHYTHAERIADVWPSIFPTTASARPYVGQPELLANRVYAGKLGNGSEASGDGWRFRGGGLAQITGRDEYSPFAEVHGLTLEQAAAWVGTPEGAAMSGAWYLAWRDCLGLADEWMLTAITRKVNGTAMLGLRERIAASNRALAVLESAPASLTDLG